MIIRSERIQFRTVLRKDLETLWRWKSERPARGDFEILPPVSASALEKEYEENGFISDMMTTFVIEEIESGDPIGMVQYRLINPYNLNYQDGIHICEPEKRRMGYGVEAQKLIVNYLFSNTHTNRIQSKCDVNNIASVKMHEICGFQKEGLLREESYYAGEFHDYFLYAILRREWLHQDYRREI